MKTLRIVKAAAISAAGNTYHDHLNSLLKADSHHSSYQFNEEMLAVCKADFTTDCEIELDRSVKLALACSESFTNQELNENCGINIGSSRGATATFENAYQKFLEQQSVPTLTSPLSTLGNISSQLARKRGLTGLAFSHSVTCSTALHSILNSIAWISSGMVDKMLVGGAEAAITEFTIAQMKALRIYGKYQEGFPCQPFSFRNTFMLGEGCGLFLIAADEPGVKIAGYGFAQEQVPSYTGMLPDGTGFYKSMSMALARANLDQVDLIFAHAPGTKHGDQAEYNAIGRLFKKPPYLYSNKFRVGHCFAASGAISLYEAIIILVEQILPPIKYDFENQQNIPESINSIMINAAGFGGNIVSLIISRD